MFRIIDPNTPIIVNVNGTNVHIQQLTVGDRRAIAAATLRLSSDEDSWRPYCEILARGIVKIEGHDDPVVDVLEHIHSMSDFRAIENAVISQQILTGNESKNSGSSSASQQSEPARSTTVKTVPTNGDASETDNEL